MDRENGQSKRRKPHRKSKTGCANCRKRRVKCDEQKPACRTCLRRSSPCLYTNESQRAADSAAPEADTSSPAHTARSTTSIHSAAQFYSTPILSPSASSTSFSIQDLALLHHWTVSTSTDIFKFHEADNLWQLFIPQIGFEFPFVTHAILSLAALHVASKSDVGNHAYTAVAIAHHDEGLQGFRDASNNISSHNSEALVAWSVLNVVYTFAISRQLTRDGEPETPALRNDRALGVEWVPMMRGVNAVLGPTYPNLQSSRLSCLLLLNNWEDLDPNKVESDPADRFIRRVCETWKNSPDETTYDDALLLLRRCRLYIEQFRTMDPATRAACSYNREWSGPMIFIHLAPEAYFVLLHQRQPAALIIFAVFGALVHAMDDHWFLKGCGKNIVLVIEELLGSYWRPWIAWPLETVGVV